MRRIFALIALLAVTLTGCKKDPKTIIDLPQKQETSPTITIADAQFKRELLSMADANRDGELSEAEALKITKVNLTGNDELKSLSGVEYLTNLEELRFGTTNTSYIPSLGSNTKLKVVACNDTPNLAYLDISGCEALEELYANTIEYLYVSGDEQKAQFVDKTGAIITHNDKINLGAISSADNIINGSDEFDFIDADLKIALLNAPEGYVVDINEDDIISIGEMRTAKKIDVSGSAVSSTATLPGIGTTRAVDGEGVGYINSFADLYYCVALEEFKGDNNPATMLDLSQSPKIEAVAANNVKLLLVTPEKVANEEFVASVKETLKTETDSEGNVTTAAVASTESPAEGLNEEIYAALVESCDTNGDKILSYSEAGTATELRLISPSSKFTSAELKESLEFMTSLESVIINNATALTSADFGVCKSLRSLYLEGCSKLATYELPSSAPAMLTALWIQGSAIKSLDLSEYEALTSLGVSSSLESLNISNRSLGSFGSDESLNLKSLICDNMYGDDDKNTTSFTANLSQILAATDVEKLTTLSFKGNLEEYDLAEVKGINDIVIDLNPSRFPNLESFAVDGVVNVPYSQPQADKGYLAAWDINGGEYTATLDEESAMIFADEAVETAVRALLEKEENAVVTPAEVATITSLEFDSEFTAANIAELKYFTGVTSLVLTGASEFAAEVDFTAPESTESVKVGDVTYNIYYSDAAVYSQLTSLDLTGTAATVKDNKVSSTAIETLKLSAETTTLDITEASSLVSLVAENLESLTLTQAQETAMNKAAGTEDAWVLADGCKFETNITDTTAAISFADDAFKAIVIAAYNDENEAATIEGDITFEQAATIKSILVMESEELTSATEVKYLTALESFDFNSTSITSLDLSLNKELTNVNVGGNHSLAALTLAEGNKIARLIISSTALTAIPANATAITYLNAVQSKLTSIDLSLYSAIEEVDVVSCADLAEITGLGSSVKILAAVNCPITTLDISNSSIAADSEDLDDLASANSLDTLYISEAQNIENVEGDSIWAQFVKEEGGLVYTRVAGVDSQVYPDLDGEIIYTNDFAVTTNDAVDKITYNNAASIETLTVTAGTDLADLKYFTGVKTLTISSDVTAATIAFFSDVESLTISAATIAEVALPTTVSTLDVAGSGITTLDISTTAVSAETFSTAAQVTKLTATEDQVYTSNYSDFWAPKLADGAIVIIDGKLAFPSPEIAFDDTAFETYVKTIEGIDANEDGYVTDVEVAAYAGTLTLDNTFTAIPSEMADFTAITGLEVESAEITTLDVSGFSALETLTAANVATLNVSSTQIAVAQTWREEIAEGATILYSDENYILFADEAFGKVAGDVTVAGAAEVETLDATAADVVDIASVAELNYFTALKTLNLSNNEGITEIAIPTTLTSLTLGGCTGIEAIDITACAELAELDITGVEIETLDISTTAITASGLSTDSIVTLTLNATQWAEGESAWRAVSDSIARIMVGEEQKYPSVESITVTAASLAEAENDENGVPTVGTLKAAILANSTFADYDTEATKTYPQIVVAGTINSADFAVLRGRFEEIDLSAATVVGKAYYKSPTATVAALVGENVIPVGAFSTNVGDDITTMVDKYAEAYDASKADAVTKKITLPQSQAFTNLGSNAFYNMTALTTVKFPAANVVASTFYVQPSAFYSCTALTTIENSTAIKNTGYYVFDGCTSLVSIDLSGLTQAVLGGTLFKNCTSLKEVKLPEGVVTKFNNQIFDGSGLETFTFPASVVQIGTHIFRGTPMTELDIPSTLVTMAATSFTNATNLKKITLNYTASQLSSVSSTLGAIVPKMFPTSFKVDGDNYVVVATDDLKAAYVADENWGTYQFMTTAEYEDYLENGGGGTVDPGTDPDPADAIEVAATSVEAGVSTVEAALIAQLGADYNTTVRDELKVTGYINAADYTAMNLANFKKIDLSGAKSVKALTTAAASYANSVPYRAFKDNTTLTEFVASSTVVYVGVESFSGCTSLEKVTLRPTAVVTGVMNVMGKAFYGCTLLDTVVYTENITQIGDNVFAGCTSLESIGLPGLVKPLSATAFAGCTKLKEVTSLGEATAINAGAFDGTAITELTIPATAVTLAAKGLYGAESLRRVNVSFETAPAMVDNFFPESFKKGGLGYVFVTSGNLAAYSAWAETYNVIDNSTDIPSMDLSDNFVNATITATDAGGNAIASVDGTNAASVTSLTISGADYTAADLAADMAAFTSLTSLDVSGCEAIAEVPASLSKSISTLTLSTAQLESGAETEDTDADGRINKIVVVEENAMNWAALCAAAVNVTAGGESVVSEGVYQLDTAVKFDNSDLEAWLMSLSVKEQSWAYQVDGGSDVIDVNADGYISVAEAANVKSLSALKDADVASWSDKITDVSELGCFTTLANLTLTNFNSIEIVDLTDVPSVNYLVFDTNTALTDLKFADSAVFGSISLNNCTAITDFSFLKGMKPEIVRLKLNGTQATSEDLPAFAGSLMQQLNLDAEGITELDFSAVTSVAKLTTFSGKYVTKLTISDEIKAEKTVDGVLDLSDFVKSLNAAVCVYDAEGELLYGTESGGGDFEEVEDGMINFSNNLPLETALTEAGLEFVDHRFPMADALSTTTLDLNKASTAADASITSMSQLKYFTALTSLKAQYNTGFSEIDVTGMKSLKTLDLRNCAALESIDIAPLTSLVSLDLRATKLNAADIVLPASEELKTLYLAALKGDTMVESLDLSSYTKLATLYLSSWNIADGVLDLSNATSLVTFYATQLRGVTKLDLSATAMTASNTFLLYDPKNTATPSDDQSDVREVIISPSYAESVLAADTTITEESTAEAIKTAYETFFAAKIPSSCVVYSFDSETGVKTTLTGENAGDTEGGAPAPAVIEFKDKVFKAALLDLGVSTDGDMEISYEEAAAFVGNTSNKAILNLTNKTTANVTHIDAEKADVTKITDVSDLVHFTSLKGITTSICSGLTSIDASELTWFTSMQINNAALSSLTLPKADAKGDYNLASLYVQGTKITALDLKNYTNITALFCGAVNLKSLAGLSYLSKLATFSITNATNADIASLDLTANKKLSKFTMQNCPYVTELKLSAVPASTTVSGLTRLETIVVNGTSTVDLTQFTEAAAPALTTLDLTASSEATVSLTGCKTITILKLSRAQCQEIGGNFTELAASLGEGAEIKFNTTVIYPTK